MPQSIPQRPRTKLVATLGPATDDPQTLDRLIGAGADVFRLNFSHGTLEDHAQVLDRLRRAAAALNQPVAVLGDLGGPKIRLGEIEEGAEGGMRIETGQRLVIQREPIVGSAGRVSTNYPRFVDEVAVGHRVMIDDGTVRFLAVERETDAMICQCTDGGLLRDRKGVNLPDTDLSIPSLTDHDHRCVAWSVEQGLDYLALSFVRSEQALHELRSLLVESAPGIHLVAKIEKPEALQRIDAIIDASDVIMIARGDLGVEMDLAEVPIIQKNLIRRCRMAGKPVIVATQMLQSMIESPTPTRAEASDVANAVYDGADALMLSGETAVGAHPVLAARTMAHIADEIEADLLQAESKYGTPPPTSDDAHAALARAARQMAADMNVKLVVVWSASGRMARVVSKCRPHVPVVAVCSDDAVLRRMSLYYGVRPHWMQVPDNLNDLTLDVDDLLCQRHLAETGDRILILGGTALGAPGQSNALVLHEVGRRRPTA